jgi:phage baseplate assembly protein W
MSYISRFTGAVIDDYQHTIESLITIFTTLKRTRVYNRNFGSNLFKAQDAAITETLTLQIYSDAAEAANQEPRFRLQNTNVNTELSQSGKLFVDVTGLYLPDNRVIVLEGLEII